MQSVQKDVSQLRNDTSSERSDSDDVDHTLISTNPPVPPSSSSALGRWARLLESHSWIDASEAGKREYVFGGGRIMCTRCNVSVAVGIWLNNARLHATRPFHVARSTMDVNGISTASPSVVCSVPDAREAALLTQAAGSSVPTAGTEAAEPPLAPGHVGSKRLRVAESQSTTRVLQQSFSTPSVPSSGHLHLGSAMQNPSPTAGWESQWSRLLQKHAWIDPSPDAKAEYCSGSGRVRCVPCGVTMAVSNRLSNAASHEATQSHYAKTAGMITNQHLREATSLVPSSAAAASSAPLSAEGDAVLERRPLAAADTVFDEGGSDTSSYFAGPMPHDIAAAADSSPTASTRARGDESQPAKTGSVDIAEVRWAQLLRKHPWIDRSPAAKTEYCNDSGRVRCVPCGVTMAVSNRVSNALAHETTHSHYSKTAGIARMGGRAPGSGVSSANQRPATATGLVTSADAAPSVGDGAVSAGSIADLEPPGLLAAATPGPSASKRARGVESQSAFAVSGRATDFAEARWARLLQKHAWIDTSAAAKADYCSESGRLRCMPCGVTMAVSQRLFNAVAHERTASHVQNAAGRFSAVAATKNTDRIAKSSGAPRPSRTEQVIKTASSRRDDNDVWSLDSLC
jgi:hypothetical protein